MQQSKYDLSKRKFRKRIRPKSIHCAYGFWTRDLYPEPFNLTYGIVFGPLSSGGAHQTIVDTTTGSDPIIGIRLAPLNGARYALPLGNTAIGLVEN